MAGVKAYITPAEIRREAAIAAIGGALLTVSRSDHKPSIDECAAMGRRIVDTFAAHGADVVRALIAADRELHPARYFVVQPDGTLKEVER